MHHTPYEVVFHHGKFRSLNNRDGRGTARAIPNRLSGMLRPVADGGDGGARGSLGHTTHFLSAQPTKEDWEAYSEKASRDLDVAILLRMPGESWADYEESGSL